MLGAGARVGLARGPGQLALELAVAGQPLLGQPAVGQRRAGPRSPARPRGGSR